MHRGSCVQQEAPRWLSCMMTFNSVPINGCDVGKAVQYITCMKTSVAIYVLNWILLFSRISKLENETSTCLEKGTQTDQEEESSEAVSICPAELSFNNIQLPCWDQQLQGLHLHFLSGSRWQISRTSHGSEFWTLLSISYRWFQITPATQKG